jgi:uncharacterized membrane protein YdbT with pleckstrin-like domain
MENPTKYNFKEVHDDEKIIQVIHRHWFDMLSHFLVIFAMTGAAIGGFIIFPTLFPQFQEKNIQMLFLFLENLFFLFIWLFGFIIWIDVFFDVWIVTDQRIINTEQRGLFVRHVSELKYDRVQDVTVEVKGIIPTMLNFGDVYIQTAAETERFIFRQIPNPYKVKDLIMSLQKEQVTEETNELGEMIREKIHDEVAG